MYVADLSRDAQLIVMLHASLSTVPLVLERNMKGVPTVKYSS